MDIRSGKRLKNMAADALKEAPASPRRIVFISSGALLLAQFLLALISFLLSSQMDTAPGLSGMNTRALLTTAQTVLELALTVAIPFWSFGLIYCAMGFARKKEVRPGDLLAGFRRFGPLLRLLLLEMGLYMLVAFACFNLSMMIFCVTPFFMQMVAVMEPLIEAGLTESAMMADASVLAAMEQATLPFTVIFFVSFLGVVAFISYRFRMAQYLILDGHFDRALMAMFASNRMLRGKKKDLFKLDLSFWWFYLLQALAVGVSYLDLLLPKMGIHLPVDEAVMYFGAYALSILCQLAVLYGYQAKVQTTYAMAYDILQYTPQQY